MSQTAALLLSALSPPSLVTRSPDICAEWPDAFTLNGDMHEWDELDRATQLRINALWTALDAFKDEREKAERYPHYAHVNHKLRCGMSTCKLHPPWHQWPGGIGSNWRLLRGSAAQIDTKALNGSKNGIKSQLQSAERRGVAPNVKAKPTAVPVEVRKAAITKAKHNKSLRGQCEDCWRLMRPFVEQRLLEVSNSLTHSLTHSSSVLAVPPRCRL